MDLTDSFKKSGKFLMLALDHRGSFRKMARKYGLNQASDLVNLKCKLLQSLANQTSGVLIDNEIGLPAYNKMGLDVPFLLPLEKSGYHGSVDNREAEIEFTPNQLIKLGANGAKLLVYLNPETPLFNSQCELISQQIKLAQEAGLPLFLEVLVYGQDNQELSQLIVKTMFALIEKDIKPNVFKLQYPGSVENSQKITDLLKEIPWVMLSSGADFDLFLTQLKDVASGGACGFLAGRSLWQEVFKFQGEEQLKFLQKTLPNRFARISRLFVG